MKGRMKGCVFCVTPMKTDVQVYESQFGKIRVVVIDGVPWFVGKDIAECLGYTDVAHAILDHVDEEDRVNSKTQGQNNPEFGQRGAWLVNESGMYSLALFSKLPTAKPFRRWVTSDVLPSIRKTGSYSIDTVRPSYQIEDSIERAKAWIAEEEERRRLLTTTKQQEQVIGELKPKADYTDTILDNDSTVPITNIAKDYGLSGQAMNDILHELGIIYKLNGQWLLYSQYQGKSYTHSKTFPILKDGKPVATKMNTEWTQKGRLFLYRILKEKKNLLPLIEQETLLPF